MEKKYEVVISGISGSFPDCSSVEELEEKLFGKVNMVNENNSRWTPGELDVPPHIGRLKTLDSLDNTFFGVPGKLSEALDPVAYLCMQASYEAICDAGVNPSELNGSKVAVYMTSMSSDSEYVTINSDNQFNNITLLGIAKCFISNRISSFLNLSGPSILLECAYSGGLYALNLAYKLIASGRVNAALVGGCNICLKPQVSEQLMGMSKLTHSNKTKSFSADADGFNRSEACMVFFLQRAEFAKRSYGTVKNVLCYNAGSRLNNFPEFCSESYVKLLKSAYSSCGIDPSLVSYVEADGLGIKRIDALELNSLAEVMCSNKRQTPLLVGSVKSNVGHAEGASSLLSIAKAVIAMKCSRIPPNLNYTSPNPDVPALFNGQMKVVTESTSLRGEIIGVNVVDISGCCGHVILQQNQADKSYQTNLVANFPVLINLSGRSEKKLENILSKLSAGPAHVGQITLMHHLFRKDFYKHLFRGYTIINEEGTKIQDIMPYQGGNKRPVWFVFSGMGSQWPGMGIDLMKIPSFASSIKKCQKTLAPMGVDVINIITTLDKSVFDNILNCFVGIAAVQVGLVDLLSSLGITHDGLIGHSVGEIGCAYADGCFTAEQMMLSAYYRGIASIETKMVKGMMAAVGLGYNQLKDTLPPSIEIACHNSKDSCTLSGPKEDIEKFVEKLKSKGIFGKLVNVANIAYHSKHVVPASPKLMAYLKEVIPNPKPRSKLWISTSIPEDDWESNLAKFCSPEYQTNNLLKPVLFEEASSHIPSDAICIEIAPHGLLQAILRRSLGQECTNIPLTSRGHGDGLTFLLKALGRMYLNGIDMDLSQIYPKIELPVPRDTPYVNTMLTWEFSNVASSDMFKEKPKCSYEDIILDLAGDEGNIYNEMKIHNKAMLSPAKYLDIILSMFSKMRHAHEETDSIILRNINICKHLQLMPKCAWNLYAQIHPISGEFEILEEGESNPQVLLSGTVSYTPSSLNVRVDEYDTQVIHTIQKEDIYKYFSDIGLHYGDAFRKINLIEYHNKGFRASVLWEKDWVIFLEAIFGVISFYNSINNNELHRVYRALSIEIGPSLLALQSNQDVELWYDFRTRELIGLGIKIFYIQTQPYNDIKHGVAINYEKELFVPYGYSLNYTESENISITLQMLLENGFAATQQINCISIVELFEASSGYLQESLTKLKKLVNEKTTSCAINNICSYDTSKLNNQMLLIIADIVNHDNAIELLNKVENGYLLTSSKPNILILSQLDLILSTENTNQHNGGLLLFKKKVHDVPGFKIIHTSTSEWEIKLMEALKTTSEKDYDERVILVTYISTLQEVHKVLTRCSHLSEENIRYFFLEKDAPDFNLALPFYNDWLKTDMKVNIFYGNKWGTLRRIQFLNSTGAKNDYEDIPLKRIMSDNITISCIGLHLPSVTGITKMDTKLGICDYSGCDDNLLKKCGVGIILENNTLITDPFLSWEVPHNWTLENASTVPVPYSLAYLTLVVYGKVKSNQKVLITEGYTPISQAAIFVALEKGCQVYSTYTTKEQYNFIKTTFYQIPQENIFCTKDFNVKLRRRVKLGMDLIINTLNGKLFKYCLGCLDIRGQFYNMGIETMETQTPVGMNAFLKEIKLVGVNGGNLLGLSSSLKKELNKVIEDGIRTNVVKPLRFLTFSSNGTKEEALNKLKTQYEKGDFNRLVSYIDLSENQQLPALKGPTSINSCLVLVETDYKLSLTLLKWLLLGQVKQITVCLTEEIPALYLIRFNAILSQYKRNSTEVFWHRVRNNITHIENLYKQVMPIDAMFAIPSENHEILLQFNKVFTEYSPKAPLAVFEKCAGPVCYQRKSQRFFTFSFIHYRLSNYVMIFHGFGDLLNKRDEYLSVIYLKEQDTFNHLTIGGGALEMLPSNCEELILLSSDSSNQYLFEEVATRSCCYSSSKELSPVFVIPGVKTKQLNAFISKLMHPTFKMKMPVKSLSCTNTAGAVLENLLGFNMNFYTLITSDLGGGLTFEIARQLELCGKKVCIILLEGSPGIIRKQLNTEKLSDDAELLKRYFSIPHKELHKFNAISTWERKLEKILNLKHYPKEMKEKIIAGFEILRNRLKSFNEFEPLNNKTMGITHLITLNESLIANKGNLQKYCCGKIIIHSVDEPSYGQMFTSKKVISLVNDLIPYENRDAVDESMYFRVKLQIKDSRFNAPGLERI